MQVRVILDDIQRAQIQVLTAFLEDLKAEIADLQEQVKVRQATAEIVHGRYVSLLNALATALSIPLDQHPSFDEKEMEFRYEAHEEPETGESAGGAGHRESVSEDLSASVECHQET